MLLEMLLELIEHHSDLFLAAIEPLILRRDCASLGALASCCRRIRYILAHDVPILNHYRLLRQSLMQIKNINVIYNDYVSIYEYPSSHLVIYSYWNYIRNLHACSNNSNTTYWVYSHDHLRGVCIGHGMKGVTLGYYGSTASINIHIDGEVPLWLSKYKNILIHQKSAEVTYGYSFDVISL